jgi:hypothetical protein
MSDNLVEEYKDISENLRHYANMRFKQLTLFSVLTGVILGAIAKGDFRGCASIIVLKIIGICVVITFGIMEEKAADYWQSFVKRAMQIEEQIGYRQYSGRPKRRFITATNATRFLYLVILVFWIVSFIPGMGF